MSSLLNSTGPCANNRNVAFTDARPVAARRVPAVKKISQNVVCSADKQEEQVRVPRNALQCMMGMSAR